MDEAAVTAAAAETYGELVAEDVALVLARAKAEDVADQIDDAIVVGCDSVLDLDGEIHGKPSSAAEAIVAVAPDARPVRASCTPATGSSTPATRRDGGTGATLGATASTTVHFATLDATTRSRPTSRPASRCAWPAPSPSTGSARPYVAGIEGDPSNVVGLSLPLLRELLDGGRYAVARAAQLGPPGRPGPPRRLTCAPDRTVDTRARLRPADGIAAVVLGRAGQTGGMSRRLVAKCRSRALA